MKWCKSAAFLLFTFVSIVTWRLAAAENPKVSSSETSESTKGLTTETVKDKRPENLVPLYRFYEHQRNEHLYTTTAAELKDWRSNKNYDEHRIVGDVSSVELPNTVQVWRAIRKKDGKRYFYLKAPGQAFNLTVESDAFKVWVWKSPGVGRIPIYSHTWTDRTDVYFDPSLESVRKFRTDSKKALGVARPPFNGEDFSLPVFYVYAHAEEKKPAPQSAADVELKPGK